MSSFCKKMQNLKSDSFENAEQIFSRDFVSEESRKLLREAEM